MKSVLCILGLHTWNGCTCTRCGNIRANHHSWDGCTCQICGKVRDTHHQRAGCRCEICGQALHSFTMIDDQKHVCGRCGLEETHNLKRVTRWEDHGGWDSIGPWKAEEMVYLECRDCSYEKMCGSTGRIQV